MTARNYVYSDKYPYLVLITTHSRRLLILYICTYTRIYILLIIPSHHTLPSLPLITSLNTSLNIRRFMHAFHFSN